LEAKHIGATLECPSRQQERFPGSNLDAGILILFPPTRPRNEPILQLGDREQLVTRTHQDAKYSSRAPLSSCQIYAIHIVIENQHKNRSIQMSKTILLTITFLACTAWMAAQGTPSSSGSTGSSSSAGQSSGQAGSQSGAQTTGQSGSENGQTSGAMGSSGHNGSGNTTLRGCLSSSGGGYTLTDASGTQYQLSGDTSKLSQHVNNEVEVKGSTSGSSGYGSGSTGASASTGSSAGSQSATGSAGTGSAGQMFTVSKVKKISGSCNTSGNTGGTNR
jgi:hypothetical protein